MSNLLLLFLLLLPLLTLFIPTTTATTTPAITTLCQSTPTVLRALCADTLSADPRSARATDPFDLTKTFIAIASENSARALARIEAFVKANRGTPTESALGTCVGWYEDVLKALERAKERFARRDYKAAYDAIVGAWYYPQVCEKGFPPKYLSLVEKTDKKAADLCSVGYRLVGSFIG